MLTKYVFFPLTLVCFIFVYINHQTGETTSRPETASDLKMLDFSTYVLTSGALEPSIYVGRERENVQLCNAELPHKVVVGRALNMGGKIRIEIKLQQVWVLPVMYCLVPRCNPYFCTVQTTRPRLPCKLAFQAGVTNERQ